MLLCDHTIRNLCVYPDGAPRENPLLSPYSEETLDKEVISFGQTSGGYDLRLGPKVLLFKNSHNQVVNAKRFKDPVYLARMFDELQPTTEATRDVPVGCFILPPSPSYALAYSFEYI